MLLRFALLFSLGLLTWSLARWLAAIRRSRERLAVSEPEMRTPALRGEQSTGRGLRRWLYLAGYRGERAVRNFLAAQLGALLLGSLVALAVWKSGLIGDAIRYADGVPGGFGGLFVPVLMAAPWLLFVLVASLPVLAVRDRRRERIDAVERDLPVTLELLATLGEAGLGFDAGLMRLLEAQREPRPLFEELATFRGEALAGVPRVQCFARLADRLDVPSVDVFASALIHAEQMGSGLAETLRRQADDLWVRRRERAMTQAQVLPVKLAVPLIVCFLPGIFVFVLGPAFHQFFEMASNMVRTGN